MRNEEIIQRAISQLETANQLQMPAAIRYAETINNRLKDMVTICLRQNQLETAEGFIPYIKQLDKAISSAQFQEVEVC